MSPCKKKESWFSAPGMDVSLDAIKGVGLGLSKHKYSNGEPLCLHMCVNESIKE